MVNNLKAIRTMTNRSRSEVAAYLGITVQGYGKLENGVSRLSDETLVALSDYFDCSIETILSPKYDSKKETPSFMIDSQLKTLFRNYLSQLDEDGRKQLYKLLSAYTKLNHEGQVKLLDYADDMVLSGKYIKTGVGSNTRPQDSAVENA